MTTNNSSKTEVTNITNQVVQCKCNNHHSDDYECACNSCLKEQLDRLDEQIALIKGEK